MRIGGLPLGTVAALASASRAGPILYDPFAGGAGASLSPLWTAQLGAFDVDGSGRARGKTLAADGVELFGDPGLEGAYTAGRHYLISSGSSPLLAQSADAHGGAKAQQFQATQSDSRINTSGGNLGNLPAGTYTESVWAKRVSGTAGTTCVQWYSGIREYITEAVYTKHSFTMVKPAGAYSTYWARDFSAGPYDVVVIDDISIQAHYAIATVNPGTPNVEIRVPVTLPASGTIPFGFVARYQDTANYWYWRITPGTAGTDFELIEVNNGVKTQRAAADVDWVAGQTYNLTLRHSSANAYTALVNGAQQLTYTDASAFLADKTLFGLHHAGTGTGTFGPFEVWPL